METGKNEYLELFAKSLPDLSRLIYRWERDFSPIGLEPDNSQGVEDDHVTELGTYRIRPVLAQPDNAGRIITINLVEAGIIKKGIPAIEFTMHDTWQMIRPCMEQAIEGRRFLQKLRTPEARELELRRNPEPWLPREIAVGIPVKIVMEGKPVRGLNLQWANYTVPWKSVFSTTAAPYKFFQSIVDWYLIWKQLPMLMEMGLAININASLKKCKRNIQEAQRAAF